MKKFITVAVMFAFVCCAGVSFASFTETDSTDGVVPGTDDSSTLSDSYEGSTGLSQNDLIDTMDQNNVNWGLLGQRWILNHEPVSRGGQDHLYLKVEFDRKAYKEQLKTIVDAQKSEDVQFSLETYYCHSGVLVNDQEWKNISGSLMKIESCQILEKYGLMLCDWIDKAVVGYGEEEDCVDHVRLTVTVPDNKSAVKDAKKIFKTPLIIPGAADYDYLKLMKSNMEAMCEMHIAKDDDTTEVPIDTSDDVSVEAAAETTAIDVSRNNKADSNAADGSDQVTGCSLVTAGSGHAGILITLLSLIPLGIVRYKK